METLKREKAALEAEHRDYFIAKAEEGSRGGEAQLDKLLAVFDETSAVLGDMWSRWTRVDMRTSTNDLDHIRRELEKVGTECCWPGRTEANYRQSQQAPPGARVSNAEALRAFGGEA
jgi:hypothetical protein